MARRYGPRHARSGSLDSIMTMDTTIWEPPPQNLDPKNQSFRDKRTAAHRDSLAKLQAASQPQRSSGRRHTEMRPQVPRSVAGARRRKTEMRPKSARRFRSNSLDSLMDEPAIAAYRRGDSKGPARKGGRPRRESLESVFSMAPPPPYEEPARRKSRARPRTSAPPVEEAPPTYEEATSKRRQPPRRDDRDSRERDPSRSPRDRRAPRSPRDRGDADGGRDRDRRKSRSPRGRPAPAREPESFDDPPMDPEPQLRPPRGHRRISSDFADKADVPHADYGDLEDPVHAREFEEREQARKKRAREHAARGARDREAGSAPLTKAEKRRQKLRDDRRAKGDKRLAASLAAAERRNQGREGRKKKPIFCVSIMVISVGMFLYQLIIANFEIAPMDTNLMIGPSNVWLCRAGGKWTRRILDDNEWWRLMLPVLLHAGVIHLVLNMMTLWKVGFDLESHFGFFKVGAIYIFSGIAGVIASAIFLPASLGVGASGALNGLLGACVGDFIQNWRSMDASGCSKVVYISTLILVSMAGLLFGLLPMMDNFAHVAGFITGILMGCCMLAFNRESDMPTYKNCVLIVSLSCLVIWFLALPLTLYFADDPARVCEVCKHVNCVDALNELIDLPKCRCYEHASISGQYFDPCLEAQGTAVINPEDVPAECLQMYDVQTTEE